MVTPMNREQMEEYKNTYFDPDNNKIIQFDLFQQKAEEVGQIEESLEQIEQFR